MSEQMWRKARKDYYHVKLGAKVFAASIKMSTVRELTLTKLSLLLEIY